MNQPVSRDDQARRRFLVLTMIRFSGVAMALAGLAVLAGKIDLPLVAGYGLLAIGALDALIAPLILAKAWKTPGR
jgi:hypothetical protein